MHFRGPGHPKDVSNFTCERISIILYPIMNSLCTLIHSHSCMKMWCLHDQFMRATSSFIQLLLTDHCTLRFFMVTPLGNILNGRDLCQRVSDWYSTKNKQTFSDTPANIGFCILFVSCHLVIHPDPKAAMLKFTCKL